MDRASDSDSEGRWFDSSQVCQEKALRGKCFFNDVCFSNDVTSNDVVSLMMLPCRAIFFLQTSHHFLLRKYHYTVGVTSYCFNNTSFTKFPSCDKLHKKDVISLKENKLADLSLDFAIEILSLVKILKQQKETVISNQIGRSGTSIGANIREANYAQGKKDFISKLEIALKEASETGYWLELLYKTNYIDEITFNRLDNKCTTIRVMLIASCRTAKENNK